MFINDGVVLARTAGDNVALYARALDAVGDLTSDRDCLPAAFVQPLTRAFRSHP